MGICPTRLVCLTEVHAKLLALGYAGSERTTRRATAQVRQSFTFTAGRLRVHRPWATEPGMWFQYDFDDGPRIDGVKTETAKTP